MGDILWRAIVMGVVATAVLDLWALLLKQVFGFPTPNWALVGRWFCHVPAGRLMHEDIGKSPGFSNELAAGWIAHYAVGISFALATVLIGGAGWIKAPTPLLPLIVGWVTVGCGWFILQPGMGAGIAASKKPDANRIRLLNVIGHTVFGLAMWGAALALK